MKTSTHQPGYAGFWRRLGAFLLDSLLLFTLTAPLLYIAYGPEYFRWLFASSGVFNIFGSLDFIISWLIPFILIVLFWHNVGATPGKTLLECRIVDADSHDNISWKQALIRIGGYVISSLPAYLGFVWMAWDKRKQGLHDKLAKTVVLHIEDDDAQRSLSQLMEDCQ